MKPGSIPEKKYATPPTMSFKQMELIGLAIDKMKQLGVPDHEMFQTVDLYEGQNLHQCVIGISALARKVKVKCECQGHVYVVNASHGRFTINMTNAEKLRRNRNIKFIFNHSILWKIYHYMFETDLNLDLVIKVAKIYSTLTDMFWFTLFIIQFK